MCEYIIRFAEDRDIDAIMSFIDIYWSKGHILGRNRCLFQWQYCRDNEVDFVIACDKNTGQIIAVLGYIRYGDSIKADIMLALWKSVRPGSVGIELLEFLQSSGAEKISVNGINIRTTKEIYEYFGFRIGKLNHYYRLARNIEYKIAKIEDSAISSYLAGNRNELIRFQDFEELDERYSWKYTNYPIKNKQFLHRRYFNHPGYEYLVYGIKNGELIDAAMFMRIIKCNDSYALRIVDFIGNPAEISYIGEALDEILNQYKAEYIDFLQYGIDASIMKNAGFSLLDDSKNIIPNYFEPYQCSNVNVWFATQYKDGYTICKADGDQDRPNIL